MRRKGRYYTEHGVYASRSVSVSVFASATGASIIKFKIPNADESRRGVQ